MTHTSMSSLCEMQSQTKQMLHDLGFPCHRVGYYQLLLAIPKYSLDRRQSLSKEVYTYVADYWGYSDWRAVEHAIRIVILQTWLSRNPRAWDLYFPGLRKAPSNKLFIATLAERLT